MSDLVPLRDIASYRSYVNIVSTVGRSCGGPIGGIVTQTIGWRWAFLIQAPATVFAMVLVAWKLKVKPKDDNLNGSNEPKSIGTKLKRVDLPGSIFMSLTILSAMLILDMGGEKEVLGERTSISIASVITQGRGSRLLSLGGTDCFAVAGRFSNPVWYLNMLSLALAHVLYPDILSSHQGCKPSGGWCLHDTFSGW
jgi:MFS family permease